MPPTPPAPTPTASPARASEAVGVELVAGQNAPLPSAHVEVQISGGALAADLSLILLNAAGRAARDEDFIFFNNPTTDDGAVQLLGGQSPDRCVGDLSRLTTGVQRLVLAASTESPTPAVGPRLSLNSGDRTFAFSPTGLPSITALVLAEIYRRDGGWRLRAVGQGYHDGLAGLARDFGVNVD